ncbi:polymorphic toxin type 47 domain-containing protein, partial [uncultured Neisseria sp.]|uniref:polymorphic toxin type 47 domain-containing protein n=1 Tax=uncultured Neisseria sp. TaxID=237778 RepID=UPI00261F08D9
KRRYHYDRNGNLTESSDQRSGTTPFEYDPLGRITRAGGQTFAFDPAHNLLDPTAQQPVSGNRLQRYNGHSYYYDDYGNTVQHELADGSQHNLYYDLYDRLEKAEVFRRNESGGWDKQTWVYRYDALDRRIRKGRLKEDGSLEDETRFVWDGSRLLQEVYARGRYTYVYADQDSYEPLAQIHNYTNAGFETYQDINYFHCDQIGIPREMTDRDGRLLWFGDYDGWGRLNGETNITGAHQPFRLQNQYCDTETGLHYNFFRYYDPNSGRFINQDPIGLWGGENLYAFAPNAQGWVDPLGLAEVEHAPDFDSARRAAFKKAGMTNPSEVQFSKYDPKTGTVVEFKGRGGAKVAYDAPHADMDVSAGHDKPHVGWQTEGKRKSNGARRGNITYRGEQHPHRSDNKDEHDGIGRC